MIAWLKTHLRTPLYFNSYLLIAMRALGTIFGFVFWALAARLMADTDVGLASGIMSATMLISGLAQLGLGYGLTRHLPKAEDPNRLLSMALVTSALMGLVLAVLFLLFLRWWSPALLPLYDHPIYLLFFVVLVVNWSLSTLLHWVFVAKRQVIYSFTRQTGHMAIAVVLLVALQFVMPGFTAALVAHMLAAIFSVLFSWQALPKAHPGFRFGFALRDFLAPAVRKTFARYSFINYVADQFHKVPDTLLPLLIINQFGPQRGAYFFVVWTIGRAVSTWVSSMSQSLFAEGANNPAAAGALFKRAALLGTLLSGGMAAAIVLAGPLILGIYGPNYVEEGLGLLDFVAVSAVPTVLISLFSSHLLVHDRLRAMTVLRITNSVTGLIFIYIGISQIGFLGAGIGWLASQIVILIVCQIWWQWQKRNPKSVSSTIEQAETGA
ncbi:oligosaccharide flippase family protein [bacterium]|nr:oligosaccharide flippase family protein [bacterium]